MADITDIESAQTTKIVGSEQDGTETNAVGSTALNELKVSEKINQQGEDITITATTSAVVAKVGASNKANRTYLFIQALDKNVKWGFDANCRFDAFKNQMIVIPVADTCNIYIKSSSGNREVVIGEG